MRKAVAIDTKHDWRVRLLEATRSKQQSPLAAVQGALAAGADPVEVRRFVAEHADVFGDVLGDDVKKTGQLLDVTQPKLPRPTSQTAPPFGVKAHALRLDPSSALPWFQRVGLPALPITFARGPANDVVVDGERFSPAEIAAMLASV